MKPQTETNKPRKVKSNKALLKGARILGYSILGIFSLVLFYGSESLFSVNEGLSQGSSLGMTVSGVSGIVVGALMVTYVNLKLKKMSRMQT